MILSFAGLASVVGEGHCVTHSDTACSTDTCFQLKTVGVSKNISHDELSCTIGYNRVPLLNLVITNHDSKFRVIANKHLPFTLVKTPLCRTIRG